MAHRDAPLPQGVEVTTSLLYLIPGVISRKLPTKYVLSLQRKHPSQFAVLGWRSGRCSRHLQDPNKSWLEYPEIDEQGYKPSGEVLNITPCRPQLMTSSSTSYQLAATQYDPQRGISGAPIYLPEYSVSLAQLTSCFFPPQHLEAPC